jgi:hypothetical protein
MGKLTDVAIRAWIKAGERFEGAPMAMGCFCPDDPTARHPTGGCATVSPASRA